MTNVQSSLDRARLEQFESGFRDRRREIALARSSNKHKLSPSAAVKLLNAQGSRRRV